MMGGLMTIFIVAIWLATGLLCYRALDDVHEISSSLKIVAQVAQSPECEWAAAAERRREGK